MIAFVERFIPESGEPDGDGEDCHNAVSDLLPALRSLDLLQCAVDPSLASHDFGGIYHSRPAAVLRPTTTDDVTRAVRLAITSPTLTLAPRGNGHCVYGQAMADSSGIVLDMSGLSDVEHDPSGNSAWVGAGALWEDVLTRCLQFRRTAPRSWTDYLGLTVGGTLSNGGVSGQAFRYGPQTSNVLELEVVTGHGDVVLCSESHESDLFFAALGGLGQFGVITRARIPLFPAPDMVRWIRLVYSVFEDYMADAEFLVSSAATAAGGMVDYLEGFAFVNGDDPVNGWDSVPLRSDQRLNPDRIPPDSGPVLYCLEVAFHYNDDDDSAAATHKLSLDKRVAKMLGRLRHVRGLEFSAHTSFVEFLTRVKHAEAAARANGTWNAPHPWLNLLVSAADIADFSRRIFQKLLMNGIGGPMLVYPLLKSKWDPRTSVAVPDGEVFYLVALLRFSRPFPDGPLTKDLILQNHEIVDICTASGYDFKLYIPNYRNDAHWTQHFGKEWSRFVERKARYDPMAVLAPGQRIFARAQGPM